MKAYLRDVTCDAEALLPGLQRARLTHFTLLKELDSEPEPAHLLVDHCAALRDIQRQAQEGAYQEGPGLAINLTRYTMT